MIMHPTKRISNCTIILEDKLLFLTGDLKTDNKNLFLKITNFNNHINMTSKLEILEIMQNKTNSSIKCKNILKISDDCYKFKPSDIDCINTKTFEYMHEWNTKYTHLIDHVLVFQE